MSKVILTGSKGMLGQDFCPILRKNLFDVIETDKNNLNITNLEMSKDFIENVKPDLIIHCAAYTNVDKAEEDYDTALAINAYGTENLAKICAKRNIPLVYISTDYVFDGNLKGNRKYTPLDIPNPINNYGKTKLLGEQAIQRNCEKYYIVRTSWLYGIHGKNFVETMITLALNNKDTSFKPSLKVVDDQIGCPTWTIDLSNGIVNLLKTHPYGIYHLCGQGETSWYGFAKKIFQLCNIDVNLIPCTSEEFPRPAKRPKYSVMDNNNLLRHWSYALKDYLAVGRNCHTDN